MELKKNQVLFLSDEQVKALVPSETVLKLTEKSFEEYAKGNAVNPVKLHLPVYPKYEMFIRDMIYTAAASALNTIAFSPCQKITQP